MFSPHTGHCSKSVFVEALLISLFICLELGPRTVVSHGNPKKADIKSAELFKEWIFRVRKGVLFLAFSGNAKCKMGAKIGDLAMYLEFGEE